MSPDEWFATEPERPTPSAARRASALHCPGRSGASVAMTTMIELPKSSTPGAGGLGIVGGDLQADGHAGDHQLLAAAEVRLHEGADGERAVGVVHDARGRARCRP